MARTCREKRVRDFEKVAIFCNEAYIVFFSKFLTEGCAHDNAAHA